MSRSIRRRRPCRSPCPLPEANTEWAQAGGNAAKAMGHLALGQSLGQAWAVSIGEGGSLSQRLAAAPVVGDGRIYTIDTQATVRAFNAQTGASVWATQFGYEQGNNASLFGGGVAFDNGRIYATNGLGYVAALDARNGGIIWQVHPTGPLRGSPTVVRRHALRDQPGQPDLLAQDERRLDQLVAGGGAGNRRHFRFCIAGRRSRHGCRRFLVR